MITDECAGMGGYLKASSRKIAYKLALFYSWQINNIMALSNINQILLRNIELLEGSRPLLINLEAAGLVPELLAHYPDASITCFNNNFSQYQAISERFPTQIETRFGSHYQSEHCHDVIVIAFPKSKPELAFTLSMIADVVADDATVIFVGDNKGGIKSVAKQSSDYIDCCMKQDNARHCLLFTGRYIKPAQAFKLSDWFSYYEIIIANESIKIAALPGVFSQKGLDKGTKVLLDNLPDKIQGKVLDFGCGAGTISVALAKLYPNIKLTLIDVSALAIASAKETLAINQLNGRCIASDGLSQVSDSFDTIISNPPFHQGLKTYYAATETFLQQCTKHMTPNSNLIVVANNFLKYQPIMREFIGGTEKTTISNGFTVYLSNRQ
ncbi:methyltransferase [Thalassotalea atypica]|uniref:methyltransferase n=1 Tax=Thalassotalea atypica TaxID=2054316 RepID=UPI0025741C7B|nr:methyltransferase [Thalassotalea atypica]